jgi:hypothetical protein
MAMGEVMSLFELKPEGWLANLFIFWNSPMSAQTSDQGKGE